MRLSNKKHRLSKHEEAQLFRKREVHAANDSDISITSQIDWQAEVTAADFNGKDFDGSPFLLTPYSANTEFTKHIVAGDIKIDRMTCADYAVWLIKTPNGVIRAEPGDVVYKQNGLLYVRAYYGDE